MRITNNLLAIFLRGISYLFLTVFINVDISSANNPERVIKVAVVAPVTGDYGFYGNEIVRGAQLAINKLTTSNSNLKIKLIVEDACLPADTVKSAHKLLNIEKIDAIVGSYCVIGMVPMAALTEKKQIIAFHTSAVADPILNAGEYTFTTNVAIKDEAQKLAEYAYHKLGARKASILWLLSQWGDDYQKYFSKKFKELGGTIEYSTETKIGSSDFNLELTKIKATNSDIIFMPQVGNSLSTAIKQARALGLNQKILGAHESEDKSLIEVAGKASEGFTFLSPKIPSEYEEFNNFQKVYHGKYENEEVSILALNAYDATNLYINNFQQCNFNNSCVKTNLYQTNNYQGVSGNFSINNEGGVVKEFVIKKVNNNNFIIE